MQQSRLLRLAWPAGEAYQKVIELDPERANAFYMRGRTYARVELYQEAERDLAIAAQLEPDGADIHFILGKVHAINGNWRDVIQSFKEYAVLTP